MTDRPSPTTPDDPDVELVSAFIDGEASADEVARVEADPALLARAVRLRALTDQLAVGDAPPALIDRHVAAAMAAFGTVDDGDEPVPASVTDLSARRRMRLPLGAVAAAVAVVALVGALTLADSDRGDDTASAPTTPPQDLPITASDEAGSREADSSAAADLAPAGALPATGQAGDRIEFASADDLADYAAARERPQVFEQSDAAAPEDGSSDDGASAGDTAGSGGGSADQPDSSPSFDPCDAVSVAGVDRSNVEELIVAVVDGRDVTAVVATVGADGRRLIVVDDVSCDIVDDRRL